MSGSLMSTEVITDIETIIVRAEHTEVAQHEYGTWVIWRNWWSPDKWHEELSTPFKGILRERFL